MKIVPEDEPSKLMAYRAEIASLANQRRKLVESERKGYREAQEVLTAEQALLCSLNSLPLTLVRPAQLNL